MYQPNSYTSGTGKASVENHDDLHKRYLTNDPVTTTNIYTPSYISSSYSSNGNGFSYGGYSSRDNVNEIQQEFGQKPLYETNANNHYSHGNTPNQYSQQMTSTTPRTSFGIDYSQSNNDLVNKYLSPSNDNYSTRVSQNIDYPNRHSLPIFNEQSQPYTKYFGDTSFTNNDKIRQRETSFGSKFNIDKFDEFLDKQKPLIQGNSKRQIQMQIQTFWDEQQFSTSSYSCYSLSTQRRKGKQPTLNDFVKGKKLGKGMFGQVFIVKHKELGFLCALKIISKAIVRQQKVQTQFIEQLKIHSYLDHSNVVQIYGYFSDENNLYILQQLCTGGQLFDLLIKRRRISQKRTAYYIRQLVQGLSYLHTMNITHRDIKPENIMLQSGVIKIGDFGWAVYSMDNKHKGKCGTPLYMSPEVIRDKPYCQLVDVWGVGLITFELLVGSIPWQIWTQQQTDKIVTQQLKFPDYIQMSGVCKNFIQRCLQKYPQQRISMSSTFTHPFLIKVNPMQHQQQTYAQYGEATP